MVDRKLTAYALRHRKCSNTYHQFHGKRKMKLLVELEKKESKKLNHEMNQSSAGRGNVRIYQNLEAGQLYLRTLLPYRDNPSKEALSESSQIKGQHKTNL